MGMCLALCSIDAPNLQRVLADPPLVWRVIAPDDAEAYDAARSEQQGGVLKKLFGRRSTPVQELNLAVDEVQHADLDKAWHGVHFLLTATAKDQEPASYLLEGGTQVGDIEVGYGPARALAPGQVHDFHKVLQSVTEEELRSRFDPAVMMSLEIYPEIWDRNPEEDDTLGYCVENFRVLRDFVGAASARNQGLIIYVT